MNQYRILSSLFIALVFHCNSALAAGGAQIGVKAGVLDGVLNAGPMVQLLLLVLIGMSVVSWAIMYSKYKQFEYLKSANQTFVDQFWKTTSFEALFDRLHEHGSANQARIFQAGFLELQRLAESPLASGASTTSEDSQRTPMRLSGIDNLERALRKATETELALIEARLGFLATTGSTSPFIGLLGTVIGIMTSFSHIAASGSASLAVVAPGISEALFATAVGLFAALPAVAAYNYFVGEVRRFEMDLNSFGSDFLNIAKRNFFRND